MQEYLGFQAFTLGARMRTFWDCTRYGFVGTCCLHLPCWGIAVSCACVPMYETQKIFCAYILVFHCSSEFEWEQQWMMTLDSLKC
jgi:hypothetical protein